MGSRKEMRGFCLKCKDRDTCKKLCQIAEEYVNGDFVFNDKHMSYTFSDEKGNGNVWEFVRDSFPTREQKAIIIKLTEDGKSTREIAYHLPCTQQYVVKVLKKYRKSLNDNHISE